MTRWKNRFDTIQSILEWVLIVLMVGAAIWLLIEAPDRAAAIADGAVRGPVQQLLGAWGATIVYATVWVVECALLAYAKITGNHLLRKWTMFAIFVTHLFSLTLTVILRGVELAIVDNLVITLVSAGLWLRAKLQDDYVEWEDLETFDE